MVQLKFKKSKKYSDIKKVDRTISSIYILKNDNTLVDEFDSLICDNVYDFACYKNNILIYDGSNVVLGEKKLKIDPYTKIMLNDHIGIQSGDDFVIYNYLFEKMIEHKNVLEVGCLQTGFVIVFKDMPDDVIVYKNMEKFMTQKGKLLFCNKDTYCIQNDTLSTIYKDFVKKCDVDFNPEVKKLLLDEHGDICIIYDCDFRYFYKYNELANIEENEVLYTTIDDDGSDIKLGKIIMLKQHVFLFNVNGTLIQYDVTINYENEPKNDEKNVKNVETKSTIDTNNKIKSKGSSVTTKTKAETCDLTHTSIENAPDTVQENGTTTKKSDTFHNTTADAQDTYKNIEDRFSSTKVTSDTTDSISSEKICSSFETLLSTKNSASVLNIQKNVFETEKKNDVKNDRPGYKLVPEDPQSIIKNSIKNEINSLRNSFLKLKTNMYEFDSINDEMEDLNYHSVYNKLKFIESTNEVHINKELSRISMMLNRKITIDHYIEYFDKRIQEFSDINFLVKPKTVRVYTQAFSNNPLGVDYISNLKSFNQKKT